MSLRTWDPDAELQALEMDRTMDGYADQQSPTSVGDAVNRIFREGAALAAKSIVHLSQHSPNERIRLNAAQTVIERVVGRVADQTPTGVTDPITELLQDILGPSK